MLHSQQADHTHTLPIKDNIIPVNTGNLTGPIDHIEFPIKLF